MDDQRKEHIGLRLLQKGTTTNNYRPIRSLPIVWKILTAPIREEIYDMLISRRYPRETEMMPQENKRNGKETVYCSPHPQDKTEKNLTMTGIDNKNACNRVLQRWIIDCLKIYTIADEVIKFIEKAMKN